VCTFAPTTLHSPCPSATTQRAGQARTEHALVDRDVTAAAATSSRCAGAAGTTKEPVFRPVRRAWHAEAPGPRSSRFRRRMRSRDVAPSPSLLGVQSPLTEFDDAEGVLRPRPPRTRLPLPRFVVLCFFPEVLRAWEAEGRLVMIGSFSDEVGGARIYLHDGSAPVAVLHPGMGGPLASHCLEKVLAGGVPHVVAVGGAGSLIPDFLVDDVLVVDSAIRDEGTSHHYLPPSREVLLDRVLVQQAADALVARQIPHRIGRTWTTDADFRETPRKIAARRDEGCVAVEMEAASLAAVCAFRDVAYGHLLYSGDALHGSSWDGRGWTTSGRRSQLLELAVGLAAGADSPPHR
jgi:uridine phosphorylase